MFSHTPGCRPLLYHYHYTILSRKRESICSTHRPIYSKSNIRMQFENLNENTHVMRVPASFNNDPKLQCMFPILLTHLTTRTHNYLKLSTYLIFFENNRVSIKPRIFIKRKKQTLRWYFYVLGEVYCSSSSHFLVINVTTLYTVHSEHEMICIRYIYVCICVQ
jgi:hypothetical protein